MAFISLVSYSTAQFLLTAWVICYTTKNSLWRPAAVPVVLYTAYQTWLSLDFFNNNQLVNPMTAGFVAGFGLHHLNLLCTSRMDINDVREAIGANTNAKKHDMSRNTCFRGTLYILTTLRGIDTSYEVRQIRHGRESSASRSGFLLCTLAIVAAKYLVLDLMTFHPPSPEDTQRLFGEGKEYLLFRSHSLPPVTVQDILTNLGVTFLGWGPIGSWFIEVHYRVLSLVSVGLGVSSPHQWPPLFGFITEAYTLRRFWGNFWHQLFRWPMQGISSFVCWDILRLPRPSLIERYAKIIVVFIISAALHLAIDSRGGIMHPQSGALRCFLIQPLGIMLEDGAQAIYRRVRGGAAKSNRWTKTAGYIWVLAFLTLVAPLYNFPLFRYQDPSRNGVPVPVIQPFIDYLGSRE